MTVRMEVWLQWRFESMKRKGISRSVTRQQRRPDITTKGRVQMETEVEVWVDHEELAQAVFLHGSGYSPWKTRAQGKNNLDPEFFPLTETGLLMEAATVRIDFREYA